MKSLFPDSSRPDCRSTGVIFQIGTLALVFVAFGLFKAEAALDGPVGFVGESYGGLEVAYLTERVAPEVDGLSFENCGSELAAEEFANYRMVVVAGLAKHSYSEGESQIIEDYVRGGGRLVLIQQAPNAFVFSLDQPDKDSNYLFGRSYYFRSPSECSIYEPENPLLAGAFTEAAEPFWLKPIVMLKGLDWENLIGNDDFILVGRLKLGEGELFYMGHEIFRLAKTAREEGQEPALLGWIQIWNNILRPAESQ